ncbi:MAG: hypothetical protein KF758_11005 [Anaerolineales bacterium]|nr:hypothetical protein [Anaerolineales bacterium]
MKQNDSILIGVAKMLFYSHVIVANRLEQILMPRDLKDYYLGAIAPDIRYYARLPRETTHLPLEKIQEMEINYPSLKSFILGYKIHIASENIIAALKIDEKIRSQFPISILKNKLPAQFVSVLIEYYYLETEKIYIECGTDLNPILGVMGITQQVLSEVTFEINDFFKDPTFQSAIRGVNKLGLAGGSNVQKYLRVANRLNDNKLAKFLLFAFTQKHIKFFDANASKLILEAINS